MTLFENAVVHKLGLSKQNSSIDVSSCGFALSICSAVNFNKLQQQDKKNRNYANNGLMDVTLTIYCVRIDIRMYLFISFKKEYHSFTNVISCNWAFCSFECLPLRVKGLKLINFLNEFEIFSKRDMLWVIGHKT